MGNLMDVEMKVNEEYIESAVTDIIRGAIVKALGDPTNIVNDAVTSVTNKYVNKDNGEECKKDSWRSMPYLEWLARKTIESTVRTEMEELINENKESFEAEIRKQIKTKGFTDKMVSAFLDCVIDSSKSNYSMPITINFEQPKSEY